MHWLCLHRSGSVAAVALVSVFVALPLPAQGPAGFDTTAITRLQTAVLERNPTIAAQHASLAVARARWSATGFALPIALSLEAEEVPGVVDFTHAQSIRISLEKEFLRGAVAARARHLAAQDVAAESLAAVGAERRIIALTTRGLERAALWSVIANRLLAEDSLLSSAEASLRMQFTAGNARYIDVLRLRTARLQVQSSRAAALVEELAARQGLDALAGSADPDSTLRRGALAVVAAREASGVSVRSAPDVDSLLGASTTVQLAGVAESRAEAARALLDAQLKPRMTGFAGAQRFRMDDGRFTVGPVAGLSLSLPFTARRANETALLAADRSVTAAGAARAAAIAEIRAELIELRSRYEAARARVAVFDASLLRGAREEREAALASYRTGALSLIELLDFERALSAAETDHLRARIDAADSWSAMILRAYGATTQGSESALSGSPSESRTPQ